MMGITPTKAQHAYFVIRMSVPYMFMALLFLLNLVPFSWLIGDGASVPLTLIAIYYWSIYRPTLLPEWLMFVVGIMLDLLSGMPVGINAFIFIVLRWSISRQRLFLTAQPFVMVWCGFLLANISYGLMSWALFGLAHFHWTPLQPVWVSIALGVGLFPFVNMLLHLTHKILPEEQGNFTPKVRSR